MGILGIGFFAAALLFSIGEMGFLTDALNLLMAFTLALVFLVLERPRNLLQISVTRMVGGLLLLVVAALFAQGEGLWRLVAFMVLPTALVVTMDRKDPRRREAAILIPAVFVFIVLLVVDRHIPHVWWLKNTSAVAFSQTTGKLIGQDYAMSATASGCRVMAFAASWGFARLIWGGRRRSWDFPVFLLLLAAAVAVVQILLTPLAFAVQRWVPKLDFLLFNAQVLYLGAFLAPIAWYRGRTTGGEPGPSGDRSWKWLPVTLVAGALLAVGLTLAPKPGAGGGRVILLDEGYLNWEVPVFGRYGERSGGMFGKLPEFLEAQGFEVVKASGPVTDDVLSGSRVLVIINLMEFFTPEEKEAIWDYVAQGGSLLILGDHTGVKGIRGPFNDLLEPVNIEFEFDSGTFWAQGWRDALELMPHPINRGIEVAEDIQIWVGASLTFAPPGRPVIAGKYGYSDIGNPANLERSYLGDRRYNPGEQLGDICLVAEATYGGGRVLVFGDTSPFQNGALVTCWAFVQRTFQWLTGPPSPAPVLPRVIGILAAAVLLYLSRRLLAGSAYAWLVLTAGFMLGFVGTQRLAASPPLPEIHLRKALVDVSHVGRFDQLTWYDDCVGGLELNLSRNGYCPMLMRSFSRPLVLDSELLIVIAPAKPFRSRDLETVTAFVEGGGVLIVSTGYEEKDRSEALLALFGAKIKNVPLAHFEVGVYDHAVRFAEAWPLEVTDPGTIEICRHPGYPDPHMIFVPRGMGGALIIGDSQFFLNSNLESLEEWNENNIMFLRELFERLRSRNLKP